jgi:hypothetical protein
VASREQRRAQTIPAVARLARSRDFRSTFAEVAAEPGKQTIISALPDDTLDYVFDRLRDAGGTAILVLLTNQTFHIATLQPASEARLEVAKEDGRVIEVHETCRVDMFFHCLEVLGATVVERVAAKLVNHGPVQLA